MRRLVSATFVLLLLALLGAPLAAPATVRATDGGLAIVSSARYEVLPEQRRVRVTVEAVVTSLTPDTPTQRFFYTGITLAVPAGSANATASSQGRPLAARLVEPESGQFGVEVRFDQEVFHRQSYPLRLSFDLVDNGARGGSEVRIGRTLAAFPVWAFGSHNHLGSSVEVVIPGEYSVRVGGAALEREQLSDGSQVLRAGRIADPLTFFAYITADRPGAYVEAAFEVTVFGEPIEVVVRAWDDDPGFGARMTALMRDGLPALGDLIGLPLGLDEPLTLEQAAGSLLGDYAGWYLDESKQIQIHYDADAFVALHEAAHAWFNDRLFRARWIGEAFASYYAELAANQLGIEIDEHGLTDDLRNAAIQLNDWGEVGREEHSIEEYAYAATLELARLTAERAGLRGLTRVWEAAAAHEAAYQPLLRPADEPERDFGSSQRDWQRFLDLLEERTDAGYVDLWAEWVVNDRERPLLDERESARARYREVAATADDWELPPAVRTALGAWTFTAAQRLLDDAEAVLWQRTAVAEAAERLRLHPSDRLRSLFERTTSFADAAERARAELATIGLLAETQRQVEAPLTVVEEIGLLGTDLTSPLASARAAYEAGDLGAADRHAAAAASLRLEAQAIGRERLVVSSGGLLGLKGLLLVGIGAFVQRRRIAAAATIPAP